MLCQAGPTGKSDGISWLMFSSPMVTIRRGAPTLALLTFRSWVCMAAAPTHIFSITDSKLAIAAPS